MSDDQLIYGVSDFVAYANQTLEYAYPFVVIEGELANFKVSKNRWVYFDLKDELASLRFFGTVYSLPSPLEDGMMLRVRGTPRIHPQYGFSITVQQIEIVGEGSIKRAASLLEAKLQKEGLFDAERKRPLPAVPQHIGLITSAESAAYADFIKIVKARWGGIAVDLINVQVQGVDAPGQLIAALQKFNQLPQPPEVIVIIRGGGSADDLQAFSDERVVRAVAMSRVPTVVAIGHENDVSLAELAADLRGSTPSNAAELLVPDRADELRRIAAERRALDVSLRNLVVSVSDRVASMRLSLRESLEQVLQRAWQRLAVQQQMLIAYDPAEALKRGYALLRQDGKLVRSVQGMQPGAIVAVTVADGTLTATVNRVDMSQEGEVHDTK